MELQPYNSHQPESFIDLSGRAVMIHDVGRASLEQMAFPPPAPDEVTIRVAYVGVCVTDLEIVDGTLGYYQEQIANYPIVPGHEVSGVVTAIGAEVTDLSLSDRVVVECIHGCGRCRSCRHAAPIGCIHRTELGVIGKNGGYSEFMTAPARFFHRIPASLDLRTACVCEPLAVALKGLGRLAVAWGRNDEARRCAVVGAGPLGRLCAMVLDHQGHSVTVFDQDPRRLADVGGAIEVSPSLDRLSEFDALIEATGQQTALAATLNDSRAGATILLLGLPYEPATFSFEHIVAYDKTVVGSVGSGPAEFNAALSLLPSLDTSPFTRTVLPLASFSEGWEFARTRAHLKVLLAPGME